MDSAMRQFTIEPGTQYAGRKQLALRAVEILAGLFTAIGSGLPKLFGEATAVTPVVLLSLFASIAWSRRAA